MIYGTLIIKNVSGLPYVVEELGGLVMGDQESVNLLDSKMSGYYDDWEAANRAVTQLTTTKLYESVESGDLEVIASIPPGI